MQAVPAILAASRGICHATHRRETWGTLPRHEWPWTKGNTGYRVIEITSSNAREGVVDQKRWLVKVLMSAAAGGLVVASLAGCGRITAKIDDYSPKDPGAPLRVEAGKTVPLSVTFTNTGNRTGSFHVRAVVKDSASIQVGTPAKTVTVERGKSDTVTWAHVVLTPGTYTVQFIVGKDPNTTYTLAPAEPAPLIVGTQAVVSTKFKAGDRVRVSSEVNVRTGPGTDQPKVTHVNYRGSAPIGAEGKVIGGPEMAEGYLWWRVEFDAGYTGWCIEDPLTKAAGG